jgi:MFS family permease
MGLVLFCGAAGALVSQQVTGQVLVRVSSRRVLTVASLTFPLLIVLPLAAPSPLVLAAVMLLFGTFNASMDVSMNAHGVALEESGDRSIFSRLHAGWSLGGGIAAVAVAASIAVGVPPLLEAALAGLVLWLVALIASRSLGHGSVRTEGATGIHLPSRSVLPIALLLVLVAYVEGGLADWGGIYMRQGIGSADEVAAFAYAALSVGLFVGRIGGDWAKDRIGSVRLIQLGMLLCAATIATFLVVGDPSAALLGMVVAGIGMANAIPQLFGAAGRIAPYGPSLSAAFTFLTLAFLTGPPIIGVTSDAVGITAALGLLALASIVVAGLVHTVPLAETNPRFRRAQGSGERSPSLPSPGP